MNTPLIHNFRVSRDEYLQIIINILNYIKTIRDHMKNAAIAIILNEARTEVLLIKRRDVPVWVLPGGGIEPLEEAEIAAVREALEETGLIVNVTRKSGEYTPINRLASLTHVFECQVSGGKLENGDETKDAAFFPIQNLPEQFFIIHKVWLNDALTYNVLVKRPISEVTYPKLLLYFIKHPYLVLRTLLSRLGFPINNNQ